MRDYVISHMQLYVVLSTAAALRSDQNRHAAGKHLRYNAAVGRAT